MADRGTVALENVKLRDPVVDLRAIHCLHDGTPLLQDISMRAFPGELVVITGPSGAGKSTLLGLIHGDLPVAAGEAFAAGHALHRRRRLDLSALRRKVGMVYQDYRLISALTAFENVLFAIRANDPRLAVAIAGHRARESLESVGLAERGGSFPGRLSGGEQQRVAIARAVAVGPQVLVADEPTGNLDRDNAGEIVSLLSGAADRGAAVVVATHDPELFSRVAARTIHLRRGRLLAAPPLALAR